MRWHDHRGNRTAFRGTARSVKGVLARPYLGTLLLVVAVVLVSMDVIFIVHVFRSGGEPGPGWLGVWSFVSGHFMTMLGLGLLSAAFAAIAFFVRNSSRWEFVWSRLQARKCASCGYALDAVQIQSDGCRVCPECGAAWRLA